MTPEKRVDQAIVDCTHDSIYEQCSICEQCVVGAIRAAVQAEREAIREWLCDDCARMAQDEGE